MPCLIPCFADEKLCARCDKTGAENVRMARAPYSGDAEQVCALLSWTTWLPLDCYPNPAFS